MWLNNDQIIDAAINLYRASLVSACPNHVVIDNLFDSIKLDSVLKQLQQSNRWEIQKHTYAALYVDDAQWQATSSAERFVRRDVWQREAISTRPTPLSSAQAFLSFLRGDEFMSLLSRIFNVQITDMNVADPELNTNYFRIGTADFVEQHADDSPGREVCMLLYLNKAWKSNAGGELVFMGDGDQTIEIAASYNRCVLFDPSSKGSEHWVKKLNPEYADGYRYNVTSWYWTE